MTVQYSSVEVTWQQASKHIKTSIIGSTVSMYRSQCLVVSGVREGKVSFVVPDTSLVVCGIVSTGKRRLSTTEYCIQLQDPAVEE